MGGGGGCASPLPVIPSTMCTVRRPESGWPQIHKSGPGYLWDRIAANQKEQWLTDHWPNMLVQVRGKNSWDAKVGKTADNIASIIKTIYNIEMISVAPGNEQLDNNSKSNNNKKNDLSYSFLIQDISAMLTERLIATPTLQLMLYPL